MLANAPSQLLPWNEKIKEEILHSWLILIGRNCISLFLRNRGSRLSEDIGSIQKETDFVVYFKFLSSSLTHIYIYLTGKFSAFPLPNCQPDFHEILQFSEMGIFIKHFDNEYVIASPPIA